MRDRKVAIVGHGETRIELRSERRVFNPAVEAMAAVSGQTGLDKSMIDGLAMSASFRSRGR